MSWTSWPAILQPCATCGDQPRTHGPLCGWCDAISEEGAKQAANELSEAEAHEHFRFHARRICHAESRYPAGSTREWAADEPMPAQPDTEATAQWANLAAFEHLCGLDASFNALQRELCPSCEQWPREFGELCGQCNSNLSAAEQRPPIRPTLASAIAHYYIYSDMLLQAYDRLEEATRRYEAGEISEREQVEESEAAALLWAWGEEGLIEVRDVNLKVGRTEAEPIESVEPGWFTAPYRCTKCDMTYFIEEAFYALLALDGGMPPAERLAMLELCPPCCANEAGLDLSVALT